MERKDLKRGKRHQNRIPSNLNRR